MEALQGAGNQAGDRVVRVSNLMNYLGKSVPETTRQDYNRNQTPHFDFDTGDFAIALLRGGKGLREKGGDRYSQVSSSSIVVGFLVDVSASMMSSVKNKNDKDSSRFDSFRESFRKVVNRANTCC